MLVPLEPGGGVSDVPDGVVLGVVEPSLLSPGGRFDPPDGSALVVCESLEPGPGVLGVDPAG